MKAMTSIYCMELCKTNTKIKQKFKKSKQKPNMKRGLKKSTCRTYISVSNSEEDDTYLARRLIYGDVIVLFYKQNEKLRTQTLKQNFLQESRHLQR